MRRMPWPISKLVFRRRRISATPYIIYHPSPPYIEDLSDDILSDIMVVATAAESSDCAQLRLPGIEYRHVPNVMMAVSRRLNAVAERSAIMRTCLRIDASHKPSRTKRWLKRCLQAPVQTRWTFFRFGDDQWSHDKHSEQSSFTFPGSVCFTSPHPLPFRRSSTTSFSRASRLSRGC